MQVRIFSVGPMCAVFRYIFIDTPRACANLHSHAYTHAQRGLHVEFWRNFMLALGDDYVQTFGLPGGGHSGDGGGTQRLREVGSMGQPGLQRWRPSQEDCEADGTTCREHCCATTTTPSANLWSSVVCLAGW